MRDQDRFNNFPTWDRVSLEDGRTARPAGLGRPASII